MDGRLQAELKAIVPQKNPQDYFDYGEKSVCVAQVACARVLTPQKDVIFYLLEISLSENCVCFNENEHLLFYLISLHIFIFEVW